MISNPGFEDVWRGPIDLPDLGTGLLANRQNQWRKCLAQNLYGPIPPSPDRMKVELTDTENAAMRLHILIEKDGKPFDVDAALWMPKGTSRAPLIIGLDFLGPVGVLPDASFPIDQNARVYVSPDLGGGTSLHKGLRGESQSSWPVDDILASGRGLMLSCYGSWAPDEPQNFERGGLKPFLQIDTFAISLWAWALQRMVDAAHRIEGVDKTRISIVGHSRLGKAALWAGANDRRMFTIFANNAGAGGSAPSRHPVGETLAQMKARFPHWIKALTKEQAFDQHMLMASIAPSRLYIASGKEDIWADPLGTYVALSAAAKTWPIKTEWPDEKEIWAGQEIPLNPFIGHHLRPGGHGLTKQDWSQFLQFLNRVE